MYPNKYTKIGKVILDRNIVKIQKSIYGSAFKTTFCTFKVRENVVELSF